MATSRKYRATPVVANASSHYLPANPGVTVLEMAIGMMILAILSVGVSGLVKVGVEGQISARMHQNMQVVGLNIVDDLRYDIRTAEAVAVSNGGNLLNLTMDADTGQTITYELSSGSLTRSGTSLTPKTYNDPDLYANRLSINCPSGCFQLVAPDSSKPASQIKIPELRVEQNQSSSSSRTVIDRYFGAPNFSIRDFAFDVISATEFH